MRMLLTAVCLFIATVLNAQNLRDFTGSWRVDHSKVQENATPVRNPSGSAPEIPPPPPLSTNTRLSRSINLATRSISGGEAGTTAAYTIDPTGKEVSDAIPDVPGSVRIATTRFAEAFARRLLDGPRPRPF